MTRAPSFSDRSNLHYILLAFRQNGVMTAFAAERYHGAMDTTPPMIKAAYTQLVTQGLLEEARGYYRITAAGNRYFDDIAKRHAKPAPLVQARTAPAFKPLSTKYLPSARGTRDGSNDLLDAKSHYGDFDK